MQVDADTEPGEVVYVPRQPGPLISMPEPSRGSDEIDEILDEVFGRDDGRGPSATDAVLVAAGVGAIGVGQLADLAPWVTVVGAGLVGLGAILPIRSALHRVRQRRHRARTSSVIGDGIALRQDDPTLVRIAQLHDRVLDTSDRLVPDVRERVATVTHALVEEVATLLDGNVPAGAAEVEYVEARATALSDLASMVDDPRIGDGDLVRRRALAEARIEVEQAAGGSALTDSADLRDELLPDADA